MRGVEGRGGEESKGEKRRGRGGERRGGGEERRERCRRKREVESMAVTHTVPWQLSITMPTQWQT